MKNLNKLALLFALALTIASCSGDDDGPSTSRLTLNILNLETLENGYKYEGWIITPDGPVSTGKFNSSIFPKNFQVLTTALDNATGFVLTIEPANDTDSGPSDTKILQGDFVGNSAAINITSPIGDYATASGLFIMASPTDTDPANDQNGLWFLNPSTLSSGLVLPDFTTSSGWKYEGWVIDNGIPVSTGTFLTASGADEFSPFSGNQTAPAFPGEDFLNSTVAPTGVTFPLDVRGKQVVISIEPSPDNDTKPFYLKPLVATAGTETAPVTNSMSLNTASFPLGTVSR